MLFLSLLLALILVTGSVSGIDAYASEPIEGAAYDTAKEINFNEEYSVTWGSDISIMYLKFELPKDGYVTLNASKYANDNNIFICVYDTEGKVAWSTRDGSSNPGVTNTSIGLKSGTYVMSFKHTTPYIDGIETKYKVTFTETPFCENEPCSNKQNATPLKVDEKYVGFVGSGEGSGYHEGDYIDVFAVKLVKGHCYKFNFSTKNTTYVKANLYEKKVDYTGYISMFDFQISPNKEFIAPYSGVYYLVIDNIVEQNKYETSIIDITPLQSKITSLKTKKGSCSIKWKAVKNVSGYQIQYSTKSNFKNAKTVTVGPKASTLNVKGLTSKKKYYVRVRGFKKIDNQVGYGKWSASKSIKIK